MDLALLEGLPGSTSDVDPGSSGSGWLLDGNSGGEDCLTADIALTNNLRTLYIQDWAISRQRIKRRDIEEKILSSIFLMYITADVMASGAPGHEDKVCSIIKLRQPTRSQNDVTFALPVASYNLLDVEPGTCAHKYRKRKCKFI